MIEGEGMLPLGTLLFNGKYRIEGYLSSGGFGNTYIATNMAFDEKVAIKELFMRGVCGRQTDGCSISISLTENRRTFEAQQEKFRKEARRLRRLNNDHIVRVHDLFDDNGTSYYVMDLIDGESLSKRMKRTGKPLTEQELMRILPEVLEALKTVHHEGIWHLDLKPSNIMLDRKGNAVLIDFGASKQLRNTDGNSMSTSSALAYTPGFAPSEQMEQNMEKFGPWTDLYALGATMYNLLTKEQPPSPSDIDEDAKAALPIPTSVSKKTHDFILWLMKPNRRMRPQSVDDVMQFLSEATSQPAPADNKKVETIKQKKEIIEDDTRIRQLSTSAPLDESKHSSIGNKDDVNGFSTWCGDFVNGVRLWCGDYNFFMLVVFGSIGLLYTVPMLFIVKETPMVTILYSVCVSNIFVCLLAYISRKGNKKKHSYWIRHHIALTIWVLISFYIIYFLDIPNPFGIEEEDESLPIPFINFLVGICMYVLSIIDFLYIAYDIGIVRLR